jgi:hypothetical protein
MRRTAAIAAITLLAGACATSVTAAAERARSVGSPEQIAWVRRAAGNFLAAELAGNGAGACGVLAATLRAQSGGASCAAHWDARLRRILAVPSARAGLRADRRALASATVVVRGRSASIALPAPLLGDRSRFAWTEMCWMLER